MRKRVTEGENNDGNKCIFVDHSSEGINGDFVICEMHGTDAENNAKFIVKAANNHKALLNECKAVLNGLENLTTAEFQLGMDKPLRASLQKLINKIEQEDQNESK